MRLLVLHAVLHVHHPAREPLPQLLPDGPHGGPPRIPPLLPGGQEREKDGRPRLLHSGRDGSPGRGESSGYSNTTLCWPRCLWPWPMLGMVGASGLFGAVFFFTPEMFPTNLRNQSVGISSFVGRMGGMIAPFMNHLAEVAIWAPGALTGGLCFTVVLLFSFLPETKGRELPHTVLDIKNWSRSRPPSSEQRELEDKR
ncbi:organic cation transporter protein-like [Babylonia areolata]|uniref:organic cation transporter protein-like n=1 Tax=Babylonia areolata TaxID=304850 RepID=UPI003FD5F5F5